MQLRLILWKALPEPVYRMDHYSVLEIDRSASTVEIKKAYHRLARVYHPDKNPDDHDSFQKIQRAYEVLSDPVQKKLYDQYGDVDDDFNPEDFINENIFYPPESPMDNLFDEIFLNGGINLNSVPPPQLFRKTEDMNIALKVSLEDLYQRKKKRITFSRMRLDAGVYHKDKMTVKIAIEDGLIVLPGEADEAVGYTECGDVVISIGTKEHEKFERVDSYDIIYREKIPLAAIYSDYYFTIQHLDGQTLYLKCEAGTLLKKENMIQKVIEYGLPISKLDRERVKRGDLYIEYEIQYPESFKELRKCSYKCVVNKNQKMVSITTQPPF